MANLIDLISAEDKAKVKRWADERFQPKYETDVPPEIYTMAELGYYYGWGAIEACLRGYYETSDATGKVKRVPLTPELMVALCKGAQKVKYRKALDEGEIAMAANIGSHSKHPSKSYETNVKYYRRLAK